VLEDTKDSCFHSSVPAEAVYHSNRQVRVIPQFYAALWTENLNILNKQNFCWNSVNS